MCVCSGFSCPFVLFMMINFVAHFLCVGRANKMPIEFAEISTKLSPYIVHVMIPEPIYDDPKSISLPCSVWNFHSRHISYKNKSKLNYLPPAAFRQFPFTKNVFYFCARIADVVVISGAVVGCCCCSSSMYEASFDYYLRNNINKVKVKRICSNLLLKRKIRIFFEENTHKRKYGA